jgi:hypothetical protein
MRGAATGKYPRVDEATITPYRDGPLLVRGPFRLLDQDGNEIEADRRTVEPEAAREGLSVER